MRHKLLIQRLITMAAFLALWVALTLPNRVAWIEQHAYLFFPLEFMVIGLLLLLPGWVGVVSRLGLAVLLGLGVLLRGADLVTYEIFARRFNPIFDGHLLADGSRLLTGVFGPLAALMVGLGLSLMVLLLCWLSLVVLGRIQRLLKSAPWVSAISLSALIVSWGLLNTGGWSKAEAYAWAQLETHARDTIYSIRDIRSFADSIGEDPAADRPQDTLFARLAGKDVFVVFAESYGRALLENEPFAEPITNTLAQAQERLTADGAAMRSAFLTAPTVGGLSWLSHASVLSGTWVDSETRYKSLMVSDRPTLNRLFREAGWRTVAAMPAISLAWPEGAYYGYDRIYNAHNFGYEGDPFNWVTMPDQYVWSALHRRELANENRPPVMAELALISSHAPWTPTAELVPWDEVGDGRIFNKQAQSGPSPGEVWSDVETIRLYYRRSIDYMLATLVSYIETFGDDSTVFLVMGDHQAAPWISGEPQNRDVPVHLISHDAAVTAAIEDWGWQAGLIPDAQAPVWRMDALRQRFIEAFSSTLAEDDT